MATAVDVIMAVGLEAADSEAVVSEGAWAAVLEAAAPRGAGDMRPSRLIDEAIDRALGPDECWEDVVAFVLDGIRARQAADGIARAVRRCGEMLAHTLPPLEGDRDEIPDRPILSD